MKPTLIVVLLCAATGWVFTGCAVTRQKPLTLQGHTSDVWCVAFSPDGKLLASASADKTVKLWSVATGQEMLTFDGHTDEVSTVAFAPDGKRLASAGWDHSVKVWDAATGKVSLNLKGHTNCSARVLFSPDSKRLILLGSDMLGEIPPHIGHLELKTWDAVSGRLTSTLRDEKLARAGMAAPVLSLDGKRLATTSDGETVDVWEVSSARAALMLHGDWFSQMVFSADGKKMATADGRGLRIWDTRSGKATPVFRDSFDAFWCVAFSPNGRYLATGNSDNSVTVWNVRSGQKAALLNGHTKPVACLAFSPNGNRLASASYDRTVRVWDVTPRKSGK